MAEGSSIQWKGLASLTLLTDWEIWQERNVRIFLHKASPTFIILDKIKCEAKLWVLAGAKDLGFFFEKGQSQPLHQSMQRIWVI
jgi:hypothetical protein